MSGFVLYELEGTCFKTNQTRIYPSLETARDAFVNLVRTKMLLGTLAPKKTVLAVHQEGDTYQLWTIAPWSEPGMRSAICSRTTETAARACGT